jgi:hypothetical protein
MRTEVIGGPIEVQNAEIVAARLNGAEQSEADLSPDMFYAVAGFDRDGIAAKIRADMRRLFPAASVPDILTEEGNVVTAFAFLQAEVPFKVPFFEARKGFPFAGKQEVGGFGLTLEHEGSNPVREQIEVLYATDTYQGERPMTEYVVDLCKESMPNQLVLAVVEPRAALGEMLSALQKKLAPEPPPEGTRRLRSYDTVRVPNMHFRIEHHFTELEGPDNILLNPQVRGLYIDTALQVLDFKLDRSGAELSSPAGMRLKGMPREFYFDQPFLLYMKKRDAQHPFLVMWIENDELLQTRRP